MIALEILISVLSFIISFATCFFLTKGWISLAKKNPNMLQPDMNKYNSRPTIPKTGGISVMISIIIALFVYIFSKTFFIRTETHVIETLTLAITVFMAFLIGFIDDIFGWKTSSITGYKKILMTIPIAIPLVIINAGHSTMSLPFLGNVNFGLIYPLIIIPLSIVGTTNGFNILAGYNGLETSLGIVIFSALGLVSFFSEQIWLSLIAGIIVSSLAAFLLFNKNPAKVFPGNTLTFIIGALIGCFAILGDMEKYAFILFLPFIAEGFLKLRSRFKAHNFGIPNPDNSLEPRYKKNYSLTHVALRILKKIKKKVYENDVVYLILILEIVLAVIIFLNSLFGFI